jgi:hypothetical protein
VVREDPVAVAALAVLAAAVVREGPMAAVAPAGQADPRAAAARARPVAAGPARAAAVAPAAGAGAS